MPSKSSQQQQFTSSQSGQVKISSIIDFDAQNAFPLRLDFRQGLRLEYHMLFLIALFNFFNGLDVILTLRVIRDGGRELNPLLVPLLIYSKGAFVVIKLLVGGMASAALFFAHHTHPRASFATLLLLCSIYGLVVLFQVISLL